MEFVTNWWQQGFYVGYTAQSTMCRKIGTHTKENQKMRSLAGYVKAAENLIKQSNIKGAMQLWRAEDFFSPLFFPSTYYTHWWFSTKNFSLLDRRDDDLSLNIAKTHPIAWAWLWYRSVINNDEAKLCTVGRNQLKIDALLASTLGQKFAIYPKIHILKISFFTKFANLKSHFSLSHLWNLNFHKIHNSEISISTKITFLKSQFSQNSQFRNLIFHQIHNSEVTFFTKFTFLKYQNQGNFWIKSGSLPQCVKYKGGLVVG